MTVCKTFKCPVLSDHCPVSRCPVCDVGVLWPNDWMDQDETWRGGSPRPRPHCVRWGLSSPQKGHSPQFLAHVRCSQTAGCIKMPLSTEVGLSPGDFVLDGEPAPPKGGHSPNFLPTYCGQTARWNKMPLDREVGLGRGDIVLDGDQTPCAQKRGTAPNFWPISVVVKRLDGSRCHLIWR